MIKFFRRISQNLLSEGKIGNYLKYALGEILLVMIGILLALQVNNWNEDRKKKIKEQNLYHVLTNSLKSDLEDAVDKIANVEKSTPPSITPTSGIIISATNVGIPIPRFTMSPDLNS